MKPHPRIRKTIKWGGAAVTVLLVVVWIMCSKFYVWWTDGRGNSVGTSVGVVWWDRWDPNIPNPGTQTPGVRYGTVQQAIHWGFSSKVTGPMTHTELPLWPLIVASGFATASAWRQDALARRRVKLNLCSKCNYNRTGLAVDAKCPECGEASVNR